MNSVDKVRKICKERKIPIYKLEKDLGFANGYIGQLRKGTFPDDRLVMIADYLGVSCDYLMGTENTKKETPTVTSERDRKIKRATELLERYSEEDLAWVLQMLERMPPSEK